MRLKTKRASARAARVEVFDEEDLHVGTIIKQGDKQFWWIVKHTGGYAESERLAMLAIQKELGKTVTAKP